MATPESVVAVDAAFDFTGFFLPFVEENAHRAPEPASTHVTKVVRYYLENGLLEPERGDVLPPAHYDYVLTHGMPGVTRWLLRQTLYAKEDPLGLFKDILDCLHVLLSWTARWIASAAPPTAALTVLATVFDPARVLYRTPTSYRDIEAFLIDVERNGPGAGARFGDPAKSLVRFTWETTNNRTIIHLANYFGGHLGGFDSLLARLDAGVVPLESLKQALKVFGKLRPVAGDDFVQRVVPRLATVVFQRQLLELENKDLRGVTKKDIEEVDTAMRALLKIGTSTAAALSGPTAEQQCDQFCFAFALKCLKSPLQDKKFNGLAHIEDSIDLITKDRRHIYRPPVTITSVEEIEGKVKNLLEWIRSNNIVELVFHRDNMRRELIVLTKKLVRFLYQEGELEPGHVAHILEGILDHHHDKNRDVRDALYDTLIEAADRITRRDIGQQIWATVRRMDQRKHWCARTVKLVQRVIEGTRDRQLALEMMASLWALVQDSSRAPMDAVLAALETLPRAAEGLQLDLLPDVQHNLKHNRAGLQSLKLLLEMLSLIKPSTHRQEVASSLVQEASMFERSLDELAFYKRQAQAARDVMVKAAASAGPGAAGGGGGGGERDWNTETLWGLFPHLEAVETRLHLISELLVTANCVPNLDFLTKLWNAVVELHVTVRERDLGVEWVMMRCRDEGGLAKGLFMKVFLQPHHEVFYDSDVAFGSFALLFFVVNHDLGNVQLKHRDKIVPFDALQCPYLGFERFLAVVANARPELFTKGKDMVINLTLGVAASHVQNTDSCRTELVKHLFRSLSLGHEALQRGATSTAGIRNPVQWIDRLAGLLRDVVVLTRPKEDAPPTVAESKAVAANGASDEAEEAKKPAFPPVASIDKENVSMFAEMMGAAFPAEYCYVMCALMLKDSAYSLDRACNDHLMGDTDARTAQYLEKARAYKRYNPDAGGNGGGAGGAGGAGSGAGAEKAVIGTPVAELVARESAHYDLLFLLLNERQVDREAIWALLKMLPPDARLTRSLSTEMQGGAIDWAHVLGSTASYQLLYSLELVRQSVPTDGDAPSELERKTSWCRAFVHRGGFGYLFVLLNRIAYEEDRGRVERSCLGHLLRILFYFMRSELQQSLGKSLEGLAQEAPLRFSVSSTSTLESDAPFEKLATLMFHLLSERAKRAAADRSAAGGPMVELPAVGGGGGDKSGANNSNNEDVDVTRFAAYLLAGSVLRQPHLLDVLAEQPNFSANLLALLCSPDTHLKTHVTQQLTQLCKDFVNSPDRPSKRLPAPFFLGQALGAVPVLLGDDTMAAQCGAIFSLISELFGRCSSDDLAKALESVAWAAEGATNASALGPREKLLLACCRIIEARPPKEAVYEDQLLAGLFRVASALLDSLGPQGAPALALQLGRDYGIVDMLLRKCLFAPGKEAAAKCVTAATREAGLEFLARLCEGCAHNWASVVNLLGAHHLSSKPLTSWRPVEVAEAKRSRFVGLRNLGATCYMNATLQQFFMMPELRNALLAARVPDEERVPDNMLWQFQRVFASLLHSDAPWADSEPFVKTLRDGLGEPINTHRQEDAYDFMTRLQEQLEQRLKGDKDAKVFGKMFSVGMMQEIECRNGHAKATAQEPEPVLQVDFAPTIEAALDSTFGLGGDPISDYKCDGCGGKVDILKRHMINSSSDQLVVMLRRFEWDYFATGGNTRKKLQGHFEIPQRLNLTPYTEEGIRQRRLGKQPAPLPKWEYELRGIVVHSGRTMDSGHYFSIIRDPDTQLWYKFDDREVTVFPAEFLDENHAKFIGECYMLMFQKAGEALTASQQLLAAESVAKVDEAILRDVERANASVVGERRFSEKPYFSFMLHLMRAAPGHSDVRYPAGAWDLPVPAKKKAEDKGKEEDTTAAAAAAAPPPNPFAAWESEPNFCAAKMSALFVWETFIRGRQQSATPQETLKMWETVMCTLFAKDVPASAWMIRELLTRRLRWLRFFLLECEEPWIRQSFIAWLVVVIRTVAVAEEKQGGLFLTKQLSDQVEAPPPPVASVATSATTVVTATATVVYGDSDTEDLEAEDLAMAKAASMGPAPAPTGAAAAAAEEEEQAAPASVAAVVDGQTQGQGLVAQLLNFVVGMMESTRAHSRRYNEYFVLIRKAAQLSPAVRTHLVCGLYPGFANRPMHFFGLYLDYFMGDVSPLYKNLPYAQQTRVALSARVAGESLDLQEFFFTLADVSRALNTGALEMEKHPYGGALPGCYAPLSTQDLLLWTRSDLLGALLKLNYNPDGTAQLFSFFCWENQVASDRLVALTVEQFSHAYDGGTMRAVWPTLREMLLLADSLHTWRVGRVLGTTTAPGVVASLRDKRLNTPSDIIAPMLSDLAMMLDDPVVRAWFVANSTAWSWAVQILWHDNHVEARRRLSECLHDSGTQPAQQQQQAHTQPPFERWAGEDASTIEGAADYEGAAELYGGRTIMDEDEEFEAAYNASRFQ